MRGAGMIAAVLLLVGGVAAADAAPFKLVTQWKGPAMPLDIYNGGVNNNFAHLAPAAKVSGQLWRQDTSRPFMALTTEFRGGKMCLTAIKDAGKFRNLVQLQPCNGSSNQGWQIRRDGEWIHLISVVSGECLDIVNGGANTGMAQVARCGNYSGQFWKME